MRKMRSVFRALSLLVVPLACERLKACDLCAIYGSTASRAEVTGPVFTLAEQYISAHTFQYQSKKFHLADPEFLDTSVTHVIPGYNFTRNFGVSLNVPIIHEDFRMYRAATGVFDEGTSQGLGDISLIARWTAYTKQSMTWTFRVNLLGGIKIPTGDARRVREDVEEERLFDVIYGTDHDHAFSGVHLHDLTLGSGSVDGIFGLTTFTRYQRVFLTTEAQYYLRTAGESGFRFGDTTMISGGPGVYLFLEKGFTLNLQGVARWENTERASYGFKTASQTGMREIYAGPQMTMTLGSHFSGQIGADLPLDIQNHGLQVVPDYRIHGALTWSF